MGLHRKVARQSLSLIWSEPCARKLFLRCLLHRNVEPSCRSLDDVQGPGAGIFNTDKKCLLGLVSLSMTKVAYRKESWRMTTRADGYASYFQCWQL